MYDLALNLGTASGGTSVLSPAGPVAAAERTILLDSLIVMLAIVVPTIVATLAFAVWFREGNRRAQFRPSWAYSGRIELIVWSIPTLVILFLGGIAWLGSHRLDPAEPLGNHGAALEIQAVALDWKWLFIYPDQGIASINRLVTPAGRPLHFHITSASVLNVFFVPRLGSQIYAMYGMATQLNLLAAQPGIYEGRSAHYSGAGFSDMTFNLEAVDAAQFEMWAADARKQGPTLDADTWPALSRQTQKVEPYTYRAVTPGFFDDIVRRKLPPAPGPSPAVSAGAR